jgi:hypothetical protein
MPSKRVILAIIAVALAFGVAVSGCNRNREPRMAQSGAKRQTKNAKNSREKKPDERMLAQAPAVRPAEVLASSVRRPQQRRSSSARSVNSQLQPMYQQNYQPLPVYASSRDLARVHEPLPEPVPVSQLYGQYAQTQPAYQPQTYGAPTVYSSPVIAPVPEPARIVHPSPELAMARASLEPVPFVAPAQVPQVQPVGFVPPIDPRMFSAPIPELEPVRYQRVAANQPRRVPVLMSGRPVPAWNASQQPVPQSSYEAQESPAEIQGWVPSPATAMGGPRRAY